MNKNISAFLIFLGYYAILAFFLITLSNFTNTHKEIVRKMYHVFFSFSIFIIIYVFPTWYIGLLVFIAFFILLYFIVDYSSESIFFKKMKIIREHGVGEIKKQILSIVFSFSILILIFRGFLGDEYRIHIGSAVIIWGIGDASAAVFGKIYGKKKFNHKLIDQNKTYEGAISFLVNATIFNSFFLIILNGKFSFNYIMFSLILSFIGAFLELISKKGVDNIILPISIAFVSYFLSFYFI